METLNTNNYYNPELTPVSNKVLTANNQANLRARYDEDKALAKALYSANPHHFDPNTKEVPTGHLWLNIAVEIPLADGTKKIVNLPLGLDLGTMRDSNFGSVQQRAESNSVRDYLKAYGIANLMPGESKTLHGAIIRIQRASINGTEEVDASAINQTLKFSISD